MKGKISFWTNKFQRNDPNISNYKALAQFHQFTTEHSLYVMLIKVQQGLLYNHERLR